MEYSNCLWYYYIIAPITWTLLLDIAALTQKEICWCCYCYEQQQHPQDDHELLIPEDSTVQNFEDISCGIPDISVWKEIWRTMDDWVSLVHSMQQNINCPHDN